MRGTHVAQMCGPLFGSSRRVDAPSRLCPHPFVFPHNWNKWFPPGSVDGCRGDPRLTTDTWVQEKPGARSDARARALTHRIWPSGVGNLLRPPALGDKTGNSWEKKQGAAGEGRAGKEGNRELTQASVS